MHASRGRGVASAATTLAPEGSRASRVAIAAWIIALGGLAGLACGGSHRAPLAKAGAERDEGAGDLARVSQRLTSAANDENNTAGFVDRSRRARWDTTYPYPYGGSIYGGDPYGAPIYGGATYANWVIPQWTYAPPNRMPRYSIVANLSGAIEGTVTWVGAPPPKVKSACGSMDNPTLRVGNDKAARGVLVYIEKVTVGRSVPYYTRPVTVGGTVAKRGCALVPAAQIVAPLPGSLTIHGDDTRAKLEITVDDTASTTASSKTASTTTIATTTTATTATTTTTTATTTTAVPGAPASAPSPAGSARGKKKTTSSTHDLQEGGFVQIEAKPGMTRIEADDSKLAPAWVIGLETPYYAITDDSGRYRIDELAPGTYEVTFWQAPVVTTTPNGTWTYGAPIIVRRTIKVGAKSAQLSVSLR